MGMIAKQDIVFPRKAKDVEQKYNLEGGTSGNGDFDARTAVNQLNAKISELQGVITTLQNKLSLLEVDTETSTVTASGTWDFSGATVLLPGETVDEV
jgi:hypothetical protein